MEKLGQVDVDHTERKVVTISQDYFYRELTPAGKAKALKGQYNFDHPGKGNYFTFTLLQSPIQF